MRHSTSTQEANMRKWLGRFMALSFLGGAMVVATAQQPRVPQLVGTWRLVATQQRLADGTVRPEVGLGPSGIGYITYSDSGVVCAFLSNPDRPKWKVQTAPTDA